MNEKRDFEFEMYQKFLSCIGFEPDKFLEEMRKNNNELYEKIEKYSKKLLDMIDKSELEVEYTLHDVMLYVATLVRIGIHKQEASKMEPIPYKIYDYQMYVSNEIRKNDNYILPSIMAFERFKPNEYEPIPKEFNILDNKKEDTDLLIEMGKAQCRAINGKKGKFLEVLDDEIKTATLIPSDIMEEYNKVDYTSATESIRKANERIIKSAERMVEKWEK